LQDSDVTLATLHKLRTLGVRISMDDFGTGYSSLSYLRGFPFDKIKIDLSFVSQLLSRDGSMAVCSCSAGRGKSLGISTTAEGVETDEQLVLLRSEACPGIVPRAARRELLPFSQMSRRTLNWFLVLRSSAVDRRPVSSGILLEHSRSQRLLIERTQSLNDPCFTLGYAGRIRPCENL